MLKRSLLFGGAITLVAFSSPTGTTAQDPSGSLSADGMFTVALTGDAIITRRLSPYKEPLYLDMIELVRSADASFVNLEVLFHDYEPYPASSSGGTYMRADPNLANELVWAGFDMVSMANNHTGDYSADGHRITRRHAETAGLLTAGTGENLAEAREARFLETHDGRVALISVSSAMTEHSIAGPAKGAVRGRPGLNPLRVITTRYVERGQLEGLRQSLQQLDLDELGQQGELGAPGEPLNLLGTMLHPGDESGIDSDPDPQDMMEIAAVVSNASRLAEYVVVTIHAHNQSPYLKKFAHAMIDAGADVFVGHGPHYLTGIDIYKGKPIMYSLGDFIFQNETLLRLPYDNYAGLGLEGEANAWVGDFNTTRYQNETTGFPTRAQIWESVVAMPTFRGEELVSVELHPISLGFGQPATVRGRPMFADRELGRKIIQDLIDASRPHGTTVEWDDTRGIGVVRLPPVTTDSGRSGPSR
jgi:poly-gamma-glutamate synthesis protein (capsule biosynthesis protein)